MHIPYREYGVTKNKGLQCLHFHTRMWVGWVRHIQSKLQATGKAGSPTDNHLPPTPEWGHLPRSHTALSECIYAVPIGHHLLPLLCYSDTYLHVVRANLIASNCVPLREPP